MFTSDNVQFVAFAVAKGFSVQGITFNERGFAVFALPDPAQTLEVEFAGNAPIPCKSYMGAYKKLLRRVNEIRQQQQVGGPRG